MNISQGMRAEQKLSAQVILASQILQMNSLELEVAVQQELEANPLLEVDDNEKEDDEDAQEEGGDAISEYEYNGEDKGILDTPIKSEVDWEDYFKDGFKDSEPEDFNRKDSDEDDWERPQTYDLDTQDYLLNQLKERILPPEVDICVRYLIGCVGDNGFLRSEAGKGSAETEMQSDSYNKSPNITAIDSVLSNEIPLNKAPITVQTAFTVLRGFEPPGIGACDLRECFLIQARRIPNFSKIAIQILERHYDLLLDLRYPQIAKVMNIEVSEVSEATRELAKLNPHPLTQIPVSNSNYITPDFIVGKESDGSFSVQLRDGTISKLRINESYKNLLRGKGANSEDKIWIRNKLNSAGIFINSVESRRQTMLLVMNAIVRRQYDFFARGPQHLRPMILQDIADEVNRDISTVNRVTNGKYVQTSYGIFELKKFFSAGVAQDDGTEVSNVKIKDSIRELINNENPVSPLSDLEIAGILEKRGLKVARRTVNKYRDKMGILPVKVRKNR